MFVYDRILYAIRDTDPRHAAGLAKVTALAKACNARLDLFHAISAPLLLPERRGEFTLADLKRDIIDLHRSRLEKLAERARRRGVEVTCAAHWDNPPHEAIVRRATEIGADLIVAQWHEGRGNRWSMRLTDWELLRSSPTPVLLLHDTNPYLRPTILAAVDPLHVHAKPAELDDRVLAGGQALATILRGTLHVVHANHPPLLGIALETPFVDADLLSHGRREFERLLERADLPARSGHLVEGAPETVIPEVAEEVNARIVVMGAVSRSALKRVLIGNTAERLLGKLGCDVLIVKPRDFHSRVPTRRRESLVLTPAAANVLPA
jgi:universal stress protein E